MVSDKILKGFNFQGLARLGANVTGIDAAKELITIAMEHRNLDPKIAYNKPDYILTTIEVTFCNILLVRHCTHCAILFKSLHCPRSQCLCCCFTKLITHFEAR